MNKLPVNATITECYFFFYFFFHLYATHVFRSYYGPYCMPFGKSNAYHVNVLLNVNKFNMQKEYNKTK